MEHAMNTYIAFLRGVNVGGRRALPMKELAAILEGIGARNVQTYIQSGNAVFEATEESCAKLAKMLATEIEMRLGFTPHALVLGLDSIKKATEANPFPDAEAAPSRLHLGFLGAQLTNPDLEGLAKLRKESERFHLSCDVFYLYAPEGIGRSKLAANAERLLGVPMTMRNWRTVCKMRDLAARRHRSNKTGSHSC